MVGYHNQPEATEQAMRDGGFHTGDLGRFDSEGDLFIVDRKKDMIIRGGYNVYPREVEDVIYEHPAVLQVAVIGVPHPSLGEEVAAAVCLRPGASVDADELRAFTRARLAPNKYPRIIAFLESLPASSHRQASQTRDRRRGADQLRPPTR
jgi:long-chain acyl-CoA synthetase